MEAQLPMMVKFSRARRSRRQTVLPFYPRVLVRATPLGAGVNLKAEALVVGHGVNHCQFFRCPPAERAEPVETAAEAHGHSASESDGLRPALDAAQSLAVACGFGRGLSFPSRGLLGAGFGRAGGFNDLSEQAVRAWIEAGDAQLLAVKGDDGPGETPVIGNGIDGFGSQGAQ